MKTLHSQKRTQQRGIPPLMEELLSRYGCHKHDGKGAVKIYFNNTSKKTMKRELGSKPVNLLLAQWGNVYKVISTDGSTITIGHRTKRILN